MRPTAPSRTTTRPPRATTERVASAPSRSLLDRLLYEGVLPKYAFPTDLVAFHAFEATNGLNKKPSEALTKVRYAPQRALPLALSEHALVRTVFIDGRVWVSGALHSPVSGAVSAAFLRMGSSAVVRCAASPRSWTTSRRPAARAQPAGILPSAETLRRHGCAPRGSRTL